MNPDQLKAFLEKNKVALGAAGAAAVAGLALLNRRKGADAETVGSPAGAPPQLGSSLSAGGSPTSYYPVSYVGASGGYDSTGSDVYNAIQPQLEALGRQQADLKGMWEKNNSPIPVSYEPGFYRVADGTAIYQVDQSGTKRDWLNPAEFAALYTPGTSIKPVTRDSSFFKLGVSGTDAPGAPTA